jgi:hypothetical protein
MPCLRKLTKYEHRLLFLLAVVVLPTTKSATAMDAKSQPMTAPTDAHHDKEIPIGFKLERYTRVWERNPFTLVTPALTQAKPSPFEKLFLTSWLKDGRSDVIFIQNLETNEVQRITAQPNESNLRLIALHLNPNPQLVEAVISDGKEQGPVKFRFDVQTPGGQTTAPVAQVANNAATRHLSSAAPVAPRAVSGAPMSPPSAAGTPAPPSVQANQPIAPRMNPGVPGGRIGGSLGQAAPGRQGGEGLRLPPPRP